MGGAGQAPNTEWHPWEGQRYTWCMNGRKPVIEVMDDDMALILRGKTPGERLEIAFAMWRSTKSMLISILEGQHPDWSSERIAAEVARRLSRGTC